jgi:hypothetical protein
MNASNQPTNQPKTTVRRFNKHTIKSFYKENQQFHLEELKGLKEIYETSKKDYLDFLRLSPKEIMEYLTEEDEALIEYQMKEGNSCTTVWRTATEEEKEKEVIDRLDILTKLRKKDCVNAKKQVDYKENLVRFWVSLRQGKYKSAVKYNKLCEEYELWIIDCAVDGKLFINRRDEEVKGETEICRVGCEYFCGQRGVRKQMLDMYPYTLSKTNWTVNVSYKND